MNIKNTFKNYKTLFINYKTFKEHKTFINYKTLFINYKTFIEYKTLKVKQNILNIIKHFYLLFYKIF